MTTHESSYAKPFLSVPEQVLRMRERGMDCGTDTFASGILERYGYYRLSGYSHPYRQLPTSPSPQVDANGREIRLDNFNAGTTLMHVVSMYDFDQKLRGRLSDVLSTIEISFRFFVGHRLGKTHTFAHRNPEQLDAMREVIPDTKFLDRVWNKITGVTPQPEWQPTSSYQEWKEEYNTHEKRARDHFVQHFREKYGNHLPIWVATEVMGFGVLGSLYKLMPQKDQEIIAARFQVYAKQGRGDSGALANWLNNLRHVRNICAHYGRVWNRTFTVLIDAPKGGSAENLEHLDRLSDESINNKLYGVLIIMRHLLLSVDPDREDVIDIVDLIETQSTTVAFDLELLGFPDNWKAEPIWRRGFKLPCEPMVAASLLDRTESLTSIETRKLLHKAKVKESPTPRTPAKEADALSAAQRSELNSYRRFHAVIEIEAGAVKYYPEFQFRDGLIIDALAEINHSLFKQCAGAHPAQIAAALIQWWQSPHTSLPTGDTGAAQSPVRLLYSVSESEFNKVIQSTKAIESFVPPIVE